MICRAGGGAAAGLTGVLAAMQRRGVLGRPEGFAESCNAHAGRNSTTMPGQEGRMGDEAINFVAYLLLPRHRAPEFEIVICFNSSDSSIGRMSRSLPVVGHCVEG